MKVEFLKDNEGFWTKGQVKNVSAYDAKALIELGHAKQVTDKPEPKDKKKKSE